MYFGIFRLRSRRLVRRHVISAIALVLVLASIAATEAPAQVMTGIASVIDGDTLEIRGRRIRLHGIDAPESAQLCVRPNGSAWRCGQTAALRLADRIGRRAISCRQTDTDRYGRIVAVCEQQGEDLAGWMVDEGWAVAYRSISSDYAPAEDRARRAQRGIWASRFELPWDWRRAQRG